MAQMYCFTRCISHHHSDLPSSCLILLVLDIVIPGHVLELEGSGQWASHEACVDVVDDLT